MLLEDSISQVTSILALIVIIYLSTFIGFSNLLLVPLALLLGGFVLQFYMQGRSEHDKSLDKTELSNIFVYVAVALAGIGLGSLMIPGLFQPPKFPLTLAIYDQWLYGTLFAVSEERFFRGFITPFLMMKIGVTLPVNFLSGAIFAIYHFSVYGSSTDKLVYVLIAGVILSFVTLKSRRVTPCTLAHILNNILSI